MNEQERMLFRHTATKENGADFCATRPGPGLALVSPITPRALAWLREHAPSGPDVTRRGDDLLVEMRYFAVLADGIMAAGMTFERHQLPN